MAKFGEVVDIYPGSSSYFSTPDEGLDPNLFVGKTSSAFASPAVQNSSSIVINPATYKYDKIRYLSLGDTYLLINFIFIDDDERLRFVQSKQDYIIEQNYYNEYNEVVGPTEIIKLNIDNPYTKWICETYNEYIFHIDGSYITFYDGTTYYATLSKGYA